MKSKKGFTALILTVIFFSALVTVVLSIATAIVGKDIDHVSKCDSTSIQILPAKQSENLVCTSGSRGRTNVEFNIKNIGENAWKGLSVQVIGTRSPQTFEFSDTVKADETFQKKLNYQKSLNGEIEYILFIPHADRFDIQCIQRSEATKKFGAC